MGTRYRDHRKCIGSVAFWSQRPVRSTNARAVALCAAVLALMFIGTQQSPDPAAAVRGMATMFAVLQSSLHSWERRYCEG